MTLTPTLVVAARIKALRKRLGMDQKSFARQLGVSQSRISNWENGDVPPPLALTVIGHLSGQDVAWWYGIAGVDYSLFLEGRQRAEAHAKRVREQKQDRAEVSK